MYIHGKLVLKTIISLWILAMTGWAIKGKANA